LSDFFWPGVDKQPHRVAAALLPSCSMPCQDAAVVTVLCIMDQCGTGPSS
jgi:hypothetical protein